MLSRDDIRITVVGVSSPGKTNIVKKLLGQEIKGVPNEDQPPTELHHTTLEGDGGYKLHVSVRDVNEDKVVDYEYPNENASYEEVMDVTTRNRSNANINRITQLYQKTYLPESHPNSPIIFVLDPTQDLEEQEKLFHIISQGDPKPTREWIFAVANIDKVQEWKKSLDGINEMIEGFYEGLETKLQMGSALEKTDKMPVYFNSMCTSGMTVLSAQILNLISRREYQALKEEVTEKVIQPLTNEQLRLLEKYTEDDQRVTEVVATITDVDEVLLKHKTSDGNPIDFSVVMQDLEGAINKHRANFDKRKDAPGAKFMLGLLNVLMTISTLGLAPVAKKLGHKAHRAYSNMKAARRARSEDLTEDVNFIETGDEAVHAKGKGEQKEADNKKLKVNHKDTFFFSLMGKTNAAGEKALENVRKLPKSKLIKR